MDYYKLLGFKKEPFSSSPDPELFYSSKQHREALQKLEISIRLQRGLNVVTGPVGMGKTTLSRQLIQKISKDRSIRYFLVLDPGFISTKSFLKYILNFFEPGKKYGSNDENMVKENIKKHLFRLGVDEKINIVMIIDEGQKLSRECMEVLRELLNFETNNRKLIQIVIFAQKEFEQSLNQVENFKDRINCYYKLNNLNFKDSKGLINHRLEKCFVKGRKTALFTPIGYLLIYKATKGFPRKIVTVCHHIILSLIIQNRSKGGFLFVRSCLINMFQEKKIKKPVSVYMLVVLFFSLSIYIGLAAWNLNSEDLYSFSLKKPEIVEKSTKSIPGLIVRKPVPAFYPLPVQKNKRSIKQIQPLIRLYEPRQEYDKAGDQEKSSNFSSGPRMLGSLKIPENQTLSKMIIAVYGSYKKEYLDKLLMHNSEITDPDIVEAGKQILFPAVIEQNKKYDKKFYIVLSENNGFQEAFQDVILRKRSDSDVRILAFWKRKGFNFSVAVNRPFVTMSAAEDYKRLLPDTVVKGQKKALVKLYIPENYKG